MSEPPNAALVQGGEAEFYAVLIGLAEKRACGSGSLLTRVPRSQTERGDLLLHPQGAALRPPLATAAALRVARS